MNCFFIYYYFILNPPEISFEIYLIQIFKFLTYFNQNQIITWILNFIFKENFFSFCFLKLEIFKI